MQILWKRLTALLRHFRIRSVITQSVIKEYVSGLWRFILWAPQASVIVFRARASRILSRRDSRGREGQVQDFKLGELPVTYINLDRRYDRMLDTERELQLLGLESVRRFPAIESADGQLGCVRSHIAVLSEIEDLDLPLLLVCEDDIQFIAQVDSVLDAISDFLATAELDVLCLSYRLRGPRIKVSSQLAIANNLQTTACYLVKRSAVPNLLQSFGESESLLLQGLPAEQAAIDIHWKKYQSGKLVFCIPIRPLARQRVSFSDIAGKVKDYG